MIKHAVEWTDNGLRYVCNNAVGRPTSDKVATDSDEVTCRNCINNLKRIPCIQCGTPLITAVKGGYWCSMKCKDDFYKDNYNMSYATRIHIEQENERTKYRRSPGHIKFMKRVKKIGFCEALRELGEFKPAPEDWNEK